MRYMGISALTHDSSITVIEGNEILFAAEGERYSKIKNDPYLNDGLVSDALRYGKPDIVVWYENPWLKKSRQFYSGEWSKMFEISPYSYLKKWNLHRNLIYSHHHYSHAAGGFYTSNFDESNILVIDAIGEWNSVTIWKSNKDKITLLKKYNYPFSLGLLYSAFTQRVGLKPNEEEYILMGMAAYGEPKYKEEIKNELLYSNNHCGIGNWKPGANIYDLAASIQLLIEEEVLKLVKESKILNSTDNLVYMGGMALNCVANSKIFEVYPNIWILPNPGDAGSSIGAVAGYLKQKILWKTPYLGHEIKRELEIDNIILELKNKKIAGVANGKAEFGPRALGNRSLLADPRPDNIKSIVNTIKKREQFRPFSPIVLEEFASEYFEMPTFQIPYMQFVVKCKYPKDFPAIVHYDGTSRIQTLNKNQNENIYNLLKEWYDITGCPMLLNTSLNIKGQPILNDLVDVENFQNTYQMKVF